MYKMQESLYLFSFFLSVHLWTTLLPLWPSVSTSNYPVSPPSHNHGACCRGNASHSILSHTHTHTDVHVHTHRLGDVRADVVDFILGAGRFLWYKCWSDIKHGWRCVTTVHVGHSQIRINIFVLMDDGFIGSLWMSFYRLWSHSFCSFMCIFFIIT